MFGKNDNGGGGIEYEFRETPPRKAVKITPAETEYIDEGVTEHLKSLHKLLEDPTLGDGDSEEDSGYLSGWFGDEDDPAQFELLALSEGTDDPVDIIVSTTGNIEVLADRLKTIYPDTYDLDFIKYHPEQQLVRPLKYTPEEFIHELTAGNLMVSVDDLRLDTVGGHLQLENGLPDDAGELTGEDLFGDRKGRELPHTLLDQMPPGENQQASVPPDAQDPLTMGSNGEDSDNSGKYVSEPIAQPSGETPLEHTEEPIALPSDASPKRAAAPSESEDSTKSRTDGKEGGADDSEENGGVDEDEDLSLEEAFQPTGSGSEKNNEPIGEGTGDADGDTSLDSDKGDGKKSDEDGEDSGFISRILKRGSDGDKNGSSDGRGSEDDKNEEGDEDPDPLADGGRAQTRVGAGQAGTSDDDDDSDDLWDEWGTPATELPLDETSFLYRYMDIARFDASKAAEGYEAGPDIFLGLADGAPLDAEPNDPGGPRLELEPGQLKEFPELFLSNLLVLQGPDAIPDGEFYTQLGHPTVTEDGHILARPCLEETEPHVVRFEGQGEKDEDWMTPLSPSDTSEGDSSEEKQFALSPLATLFEHLTEASEPVAYQVLFTPKYDWAKRQRSRLEEIKNSAGENNFLDEIIQSAFSRPDIEDFEREEPDRVEKLRRKSASSTFTVNVRAVGFASTHDVGDDPVFPRAGSQQSDDLRTELRSLTNLLDPLDGEYYEIDGRYLTNEDERYEGAVNFLDRNIVATEEEEDPIFSVFDDAHWPELILSPAELASLFIIPPSRYLSKTGQRGIQSKHIEQDPLPKPAPELLNRYKNTDGIDLGYALDEEREHDEDPVVLPKEKLTEHYLRAASTGHGKSIGVINDMLSLREKTEGPNVLVDPKGGLMPYNYMRSHFANFGTLEDVYFFRVPEDLPAISFFDIRPQLANGADRKTAIQDTVAHFHDLMRMIMGYSTYDGAFVAKEIISFMLRALFDKRYGQDSFTFDEFREAVEEYHETGRVPRVCEDNAHIEEVLSDKFRNSEDEDFDASMDAVKNRLNKVSEYDHLMTVLNCDPEWNEEKEQYAEEVFYEDMLAGKEDPSDDDRPESVFHFEQIINEDVTVIFDIGDLRSNAQDAFAVLLLSNLWDSIQSRGRERTDDEKIINLIIDEAASVAGTTLVYEELLPQGRGFGLSMGLVMQFPAQVNYGGDAGRRAYNEVLNNIATKLIGSIEVEEELAKALAHDQMGATEIRNRIGSLPSGEWIVDMPESGFGKQPPEPFSLAPLPMPVGHPDGPYPLPPEVEDTFDEEEVSMVQTRTNERFGIDREGEDDDSETLTDDSGGDGTGDPDQPADDVEYGTSEDDDGDQLGMGGSDSDGGDDTADGSADDSDGTASGNQPPFDDPFGFEDRTFPTKWAVIGAGKDVIADGDNDAEIMYGLGQLARIADEKGHPVTFNDLNNLFKEFPEKSAVLRTEGESPDKQNEARDAGDADGDATGETDRADTDQTDTSQPDPDAEVTAMDDQLGTDGDAWTPGDSDVDGESAEEQSDDPEPEGISEFKGLVGDYSGDDVPDESVGDSENSDDTTDEQSGENTDDHADSKGEDRPIDSDSHSADEQTETEDSHQGPSTESGFEDLEAELETRVLVRDIEESELHKYGVAKRDARFMGAVMAAMERKLECYSLLQPMSELRDAFGDVNVSHLVEEDFLEKHSVLNNQRYYTVTDKGRRLVTGQRKVGDLGEKVPHMVGVDLAAKWLTAFFDDAHSAARYPSLAGGDEGEALDVAAYNHDGDMRYIVEVERASNNADTVVKDYEQLAGVDGRAIWVVDSQSTAKDILEVLADAGKIEDPITGRSLRTYESIREALLERDLPGMAELWGMSELKEEVENA